MRKKKPIKRGAPEKQPADFKKNRCVRVSDNAVTLINEKTKMTLQQFVDEKIKDLILGEK